MLIKVADLRWFQRRKRPPCLVGNVGGFQLLLVGRHQPAPGEPDFTLLIGRYPTDEWRPLPPVWDDTRKCWIGPGEPDYPGGPHGGIEEWKALCREEAESRPIRSSVSAESPGPSEPVEPPPNTPIRRRRKPRIRGIDTTPDVDELDQQP